MRLEVTVSKLKQQHDEMMQEKTKVSSELVASEEEKLKVCSSSMLKFTLHTLTSLFVVNCWPVASPDPHRHAAG